MVMSSLRRGFDLLGDCWYVMSCKALAGYVERVLWETQVCVVFEEISEEGDEMGGCCAGVVDFFGAIIVGKTHSDGLVDT